MAYITLKQCGRGSIVGAIVSYISITLIKVKDQCYASELDEPSKIMPRNGSRPQVLRLRTNC